MNSDVSYRGLIHHAQLGNQESMNHLVELVKERLFAHIYRLTLNYDLAEDLLQETLMEMVSLGALKSVNRMDADILHIPGNSFTNAGNLF